MRLRFLGLFVAATFALSAEYSARAETRPAETCSRAMFRVVVDVGHTEKAFGATSARGLTEFSFNLNLAKRIEQDLLAAGFRRSVLLISEGRSWPALGERIKRANAMRADLFLSVHHDSVPDKFLETWEFEGVKRGYSDRFSGHSIFISYDNSDLPGSLLFARMLGQQLKDRGLHYTPHYTQRFMGHRQRLLVDAQVGVYRYDQLLVLRDTDMPAVLLEAGSIINRDEELRMGKPEQQKLISAGVTDAVASFCKGRQPRTPPVLATRAGQGSKQATGPATAASGRVKQR